jgi:hypothetical protein
MQGGKIVTATEQRVTGIMNNNDPVEICFENFGNHKGKVTIITPNKLWSLCFEGMGYNYDYDVQKFFRTFHYEYLATKFADVSSTGDHQHLCNIIKAAQNEMERG